MGQIQKCAKSKLTQYNLLQSGLPCSFFGFYDREALGMASAGLLRLKKNIKNSFYGL